MTDPLITDEEEKIATPQIVVVQSFDIPCYIQGRLSSVKILVGAPKIGNHPIAHQNKFLSEERGAVIPKEILDTLEKLLDISQRNGVSFPELCEYALKSLQASNFIVPKEESENPVT